MKALHKILFPQQCMMCATPDISWCKPCQDTFFSQDPTLLRPAGQREKDSGHDVKGTVLKSTILKSTVPFPHSFFALYSSGFETMIKNFKSNYNSQCIEFLAVALAQTLLLHAQQEKNFYCIAIPSSKKSKKNRGFDHIALLLEKAILYLQRQNIRNFYYYPCLKQLPKKDQAALNVKDRQKNIRNTMMFQGAIPQTDDNCYLIVDDICTTGATIVEAALTLKKSGIHVDGVTTLCLVP